MRGEVARHGTSRPAPPLNDVLLDTAVMQFSLGWQFMFATFVPLEEARNLPMFVSHNAVSAVIPADRLAEF